MDFLLYELFQNIGTVLLVLVVILLFFKKSIIVRIVQIMIVVFVVYLHYGVFHNDFNLIPYAEVSVDGKSLTMSQRAKLNSYLNSTRKVIRSYNYPTALDKPKHIFLEYEKGKDSEYIAVYAEEGIVFKGYFLDLSYHGMISSSFDYYILTHELSEFFKEINEQT